MKEIFSGILSTVGNIGSFFGGIFSALQFFSSTDRQKKSRKIVWRVYQFGSIRVTEFTFKESERA